MTFSLRVKVILEQAHDDKCIKLSSCLVMIPPLNPCKVEQMTALNEIPPLFIHFAKAKQCECSNPSSSIIKISKLVISQFALSFATIHQPAKPRTLLLTELPNRHSHSLHVFAD